MDINFNYTYIDDDSTLDELKDWVKGRKFILFDLETGPAAKYEKEWEQNNKVALDPYRSKIVTAQIGDKYQQFIIDVRGKTSKTIDYLKAILSRKDIVFIGVNLRFDCKMVKHHWGVTIRRVVDAMIMEQIIRCGIFPGKNDGEHGNTGGVVRKYTSMAALVKRYFDLEIDKDKDLRTGLWKTLVGEFSARQLQYMAGDCIYPHLIVKLQKQLIIDRGLENVIQLENNLVPVMADMELTGIPFDTNYWLSLLQETEEQIVSYEKKLDSIFNEKILAQGNLFGGDEIIRKTDYGSWQQLAKALDRIGVKGFVSSNGKPLSTASQVIKLRKIEGSIDPELADTIIEYRGAKKKADAYGLNFIKAVNPVTGRIHPNFTQACLVTGRQSCSPGMQTIPRVSVYRHAFNSPKGYLLIILDASQIEARISADTTEDWPAIEVFKKNQDIYKVDGEKLFNKEIIKGTPEGDALRQRAKAAWLGLTYGQGKKKFNRYCRVFLGEDVPKEESDALYDGFFRIHHRMKSAMDTWSANADPLGTNEWFEDVLADQFTDPDKMREKIYPILLDRFWGDEIKANNVLKRLIDRKGKVTYSTTKLGRKRFFRPDWIGWWTAGRNHPVQGLAADIQKSTEIAFQNMHWDEGYDANIINVVHDEIITLVREDQAEELYNRQIEIGTEVGQKFLDHVPMKLEGGISDKWKKF